MSPGRLSYALITPVRDDRNNLARLAESVDRQTIKPCAWVIVDTGSTDDTLQLAAGFAGRLPFLRTLSVTGREVLARGGPIVRAFHAGIETLEPAPDVVIKLDADVSFAPDYCERLLDAFAVEPDLGLASGICTEFRAGKWQALFGTRHHVWGASRAYRWTCLQQLLPLEERQGWDEIDSIKAQIRGWRARTLADVPFRHHRPEGIRDGSARIRWGGQGSTAHYMGYSLPYLLIRAVWRAIHEPAALAMLTGYASAVIHREPRCPDADVRAHLRNEQSMRRLPLRLLESLGRVI